MNLYNSVTACALCHQLTPTEAMIDVRLGKICIKCDIKMTKADKTSKKLMKSLK